MNLAKKITYNTFFQLTGKAVSLIVNLYLARLLLNYFTPDTMGQYTAVFSYSQLFIFIVDLGLVHIILSELGKAKDSKEESLIISQALSFKLVAVVIFFIITILGSFIITGFSNLERLCIIITDVFFISISFISVFQSLFQKHLKTFFIAIAEILGKVFILFFTWLFIHYNLNLFFIIFASVIGALLNLLFLYFLARRKFKIIFIFDIKSWRRFISISWPVILASLFSFIFYKGDILVIKQFRSNEELGWYGAVYKILEIVVSLSLIFSSIATPQIAKLWKNKEYKKLEKILNNILIFLFFLGIPLVFSIQVLAEPLILFFANSNYLPAVRYFKILAIASVFILISPFFLQLAVVIDRQKKILKPKFIIAFISLFAYLLLIPSRGVVAAAWITVIAEFTNLLCLYIICKNKLKIKIQIFKVLKIFVSSVIMWMFMYYIFCLTKNLFIISAIGLISYLFFIFLFFAKSVFRKKRNKNLEIFFILLFFILPVFTKAESYPKLASYFLDSVIDEKEIKYLSKFDLIILTMEAQDWSKSSIEKIRKKNPDIDILAYVPSQSFNAKSLSDLRAKLQIKIDDSWYLRDSSGNKISRWPSVQDINITQTGWQKVISSFVEDELMPTKCGKKKCWDGVFYDMVDKEISWLNDGDLDLNGDNKIDDKNKMNSSWREAYKEIMKVTRKKIGKKKLILVNGASTESYQKYINGRMYEHFPYTWGVGDAKWSDIIEDYQEVKKLNAKPVAIIMAADGNKKDYQAVRYGLASTLLGNAMYAYDYGPEDHHKSWWYDEFNVSLGNPISSAYNTLNSASTIEDGVWRRDFENGIVLLNSTSSTQKVALEKGFEKINGTQDKKTNNGKVVGSVTLKSRDGIIMLGRKDSISEAPFVNGDYAKVFNKKGGTVRNSFYSYDSKYPGGAQVVELPDINKTVVADATYVKIYKNGNLKAQFAPYGEGFTGGVNIAVDRLYSKKKNTGKYYIVTGTKTYGPHVRIYDLGGNLKDPGCFPYAESFRGGVFVAVGDVVGSNAGKEIVVSAGLNGGPHVRILNNKCELISPGFMAYDPALRTGINVATGDVDNDGKEEIITGTGLGAGPEVKVFTKDGKLESSFFAFTSTDRNGVKVAVSDIDGDNKEEIIATTFANFGY